MAIIRKNELKQMEPALMQERLDDLRKELIRYKSQLATGTPPENPGKIRAVKRTIAKLNTMIRLKQGDKPVKQEEVKQKA